MEPFFKLHENKQLHRQINILTYLRKRNDITSITELVQEIGCTPPTLRSDIQALRAKLPPSIHLQSIKMIGYRLKIPDGETLDTYLLSLVRETITYKIIDRSLKGNQQSFEAMRLEYHLSSSALRKIIQHMNHELKNYRIQLSPKNGDLVGKENEIRFFFFNFYTSFRRTIITDHSYLFSQETYKVMFAELEQVFQSHLHISNFRATLWLSILKERWLRRKQGEIPSETLSMIQSRKSFKRFSKKITPFLREILGIQQLSVNELVWAYLIALHCISYSSSNYQETRSHKATHYQEEAPAKKRIKQFLLDEALIDGTTKEGIEQMSAYLANLRLLNKITDGFENHPLAIDHLVDPSFELLYHSWQDRLQQHKWQEILPMTCIKDVALSLSMIQSSYQQIQRRKKANNRFYFSWRCGYDNFLMAMIQKWLPETYHPLFLFDQPIKQTKIDELEACLIVSNYDLTEKMACEVIQIAQIPTHEEWKDLKLHLIERASSHS